MAQSKTLKTLIKYKDLLWPRQIKYAITVDANMIGQEQLYYIDKRLRQIMLH